MKTQTLHVDLFYQQIAITMNALADSLNQFKLRSGFLLPRRIVVTWLFAGKESAEGVADRIKEMVQEVNGLEVDLAVTEESEGIYQLSIAQIIGKIV